MGSLRQDSSASTTSTPPMAPCVKVHEGHTQSMLGALLFIDYNYCEGYRV
jgi:hypothetical protein